jgi:hypothetical protein
MAARPPRESPMTQPGPADRMPHLYPSPYPQPHALSIRKNPYVSLENAQIYVAS